MSSNVYIYLGVVAFLYLLFLVFIFSQIKRVKKIKLVETSSVNSHSKLVRTLSEFDITMLGVGGMICAGIFVLTGIAAGIAGPALILAFVLNGFATGFVALIYAELGSAVPEAGGGYLWVKSSLGPYQAFLSGWINWLAHIVAGSLYALGFGSYLVYFLENFGIISNVGNRTLFSIIIAIIVIALFIFINYLGAMETGKVGNVVTVTKLIILFTFIVSGLVAIFKSPQSNIAKLNPPFPPELGTFAILIAMGFTFIAFEGYEIIVQTGEEVKNPNTSVPRAVMFSLVLVIPIYIFVAFVALAAATPNEGQQTWQFLSNLGELGLAEVARDFMPLGISLLLIGGLVSTLSALNATLYSSARVSFVMGRDGLLPKSFSQVNKWRRSPHVAIFVSGFIMICITFVPLEEVATAAALLFVFLFLQVVFSIFKIRKTYGDKLIYGYKIQYYPLIPIVAVVCLIILGIALIIHSNVVLLGAIIWLLIGTVIWFGIIKRRLDHELDDAFSHYLIEQPNKIAPELKEDVEKNVNEGEINEE